MTKKESNNFTDNENFKPKSDEVTENDESDYLEECMGANGVWQVCVSSAALTTRYIAMVNLTSIVFLTPTTDYACVEFLDNTTTKAENKTCYDNCAKYMYHSEVMKKTLISEFGLICKSEWLASFTQTILMFGVVIGVSLFGWMSDRYGRRIALIWSTLINIISMISTPFAPTYWIFNFLRFITGVASGGSLILGIPFSMELVGKRYREYVGALSIIPDALAESSLALYAYFLLTWNAYLLGIGLACSVTLVLVYLVPESPRWLISNRKIDQALEIIIGAAKFNKLNTEHIKETVMNTVAKMKILENEKVTTSYLDFFKNGSLRIITISTLIIWTVISVTYYGIYQYMTFLGVNVYITVVILGLIQIPICPFQIVVTRIFDRKTSLAACLLTTGVTMVGLIFTPEGHWSSAMLGVIGFSATSFCYTIVYIYQSELFPTPLRNMAFGLASAAGQWGAMAAPFIANLSPVWIPSLIFSVLSVVATGLCFLLPETKGKNLKDVINS